MKYFLALIICAMAASVQAGTWKLNPKTPTRPVLGYNPTIYVIRERCPSRRVHYPTYRYRPSPARSYGGGGYVPTPRYVEPLMIINPYVKD